jgi:hypothetical protein
VALTGLPHTWHEDVWALVIAHFPKRENVAS